MTARSSLTTGIALALALVVAVAGTAQASAKKSKPKPATAAFTVSGQVSGTLGFNKTESCSVENSREAAGLYTIEVSLTDKTVQPTKATWALVIEAKVGQTPYPAAYPNEVTLSASSTAGPLDTWSAGGVSNTPTGSGTFTLAAKGKGGTLTRMVLSPSREDPGSATGPVTISGKWAC